MSTWHHSAQLGTDRDTMRCVVDEKGDLVFVSPTLAWSLGVNAVSLSHKPLGSVLKIVSAHDSLHQSIEFENLLSGFYEIALLRHGRDPLMLQARIDRIEGPGNRKYTVIWLDPDNKLKRQKDNNFNSTAYDFTSFIVDTQRTDKRPEEKKPDLDYISKEDGELRHFLNLTSDLLGVYRRDGSFVRVNAAFNKVLGYSDAELKKHPFIDLIHPEDKAHVLAQTQKMLQVPEGQEMRIDFESRIRCKDGGVRWVRWVHKLAGEHIYIVGRDITNIKQHESALDRRESQLSEAQKIGRMGHWYWEVDQRSMEWSDQIYTIFGVNKADFSPTMDNVNSFLLKRDLDKINKAFQRALVRKQDYELEFRLRSKTGSIRYIHCEGRCKINAQTGKVEALFGIMQDITERTLHEQALCEAKDAAELAYASKTRFLANMSHELRTPLNAIIGFSEMIQRQLLGPVGNARYLDYIGGIRESGEHLLDLINDILDMSKIEIGKYELHIEEINVGKLMRLAVHMVEQRASDASIKLITDTLPDDLQIVADRRALMQVLLNLLSNAVKFTPEGGSVEVRCQRDLGGIAIMIMDTGVGIPKEKLELVTMPFEQVGSELTRKHEGSGLGLAITKELVELHGGTLDIQSDINVGTVITVLLPEKIPKSKPAKNLHKEAVPVEHAAKEVH